MTAILLSLLMATASADLIGGGDVSWSRREDTVYLTVHGPNRGLASICVADGNVVRVLHASAALGEARYQREDDRWLRRQPFSWSVRDSPRTGPATEKVQKDYLAANGWLANSSHSGSAQREFVIRAGGDARFAVTFLSTDAMTVSYWPSFDDDCRSLDLTRGDAGVTLRFDPARWKTLR